MSKKYTKSFFIFRRDFRLHDNIGLMQACKQSESIIPIFIFDPRQIGKSNEFRSLNAIQCMIESLNDLEDQLKAKGGNLHIFYGIGEVVIEKLLKQQTIDAVFVNADYTPFSMKRDEQISHVCSKLGVAFESCHDILINEPQRVKKEDGTPYSKFTPFFKKAKHIPVDKPESLRNGMFYAQKISGEKSPDIYKKILVKRNRSIHIHGGRKEGLRILHALEKFKDYAKERDIPSIHTTHLSAHLKFGTISIREVYDEISKKFGEAHPLVRQLYWRDFYTYIAYHSPFVYGQPFQEKYKKLWWSTSKKAFEAWCCGETGFPLVDAGMRQLNKTGFMHNRVRMVVASFLTKDLHINWLWGEKYFAQKLVDYDPALNNGNWQWTASTGCDAQPYFRIFNPWLQQKKFDPKCIYIKRYIPELQKVEPSILHEWFKKDLKPIEGYPRPIVDHKKESSKAKQLFRTL
jgi:deoxyribodipyrimidine photo-lyase